MTPPEQAAAADEDFEAWWARLGDGWPVTEPWKRVARAAWEARAERATEDFSRGYKAGYEARDRTGW